jgi:hypothetical protein
MCCGQKRSQLQSSPTPIRARSARQTLSANRQGQVIGTQLSALPKMATVSPHPFRPPARTVQPAPPPPTSAPHSSVAIRYLETSPVRVQGLVTGRRYEFSPSQSVQSVDARDALPLLNTRFFSRA